MFDLGRILGLLLREMGMNDHGFARYMKHSVRQENAVAKRKDSGV